ncbi:MAG: L,D-transpeptidase family protein [Nocardioides sp.]|nr:L,D-transpeptidase family protein [Nocardioides sp.]
MSRRVSRHGAVTTLIAVLAMLSALVAPAAVAGTGPGTSTQQVRTASTFVPMRLGDWGWRVRVLQSRLHQLGLHSEIVHNRFDAETRAGVVAFERSRGWKADGVVGERTLRAIVAVTEKPTYEALNNIYTPGEPILQRGDRGRLVRNVQARLKQIGWFSGLVTGYYGRPTVRAVRGFQAKRAIPVTGKVDRRTLDRLRAMTRQPTRAELFNIVATGTPLDRRCRTGRVMCIDKTSRSLRWVVDGVVIKTVDVRFGSEATPTREGAFAVFSKSRDHVSSLYHTSMPFAMFFSGGQAVHYSPDFAANGYNGSSHGCVNVRDYVTIAWLFDRVHIGDKVIVYRS